MTLADPDMTFDPNNALPCGLGFFLPNLVAKGHFKQFDPYLTPTDPYMNVDPSNALRFGLGFFLPNLVAIGHI